MTGLLPEQQAEMDKQHDRLVLELQNFLEEGELSKLRGKGAARKLRELKNEDGTYVFWDVKTDANTQIAQYAMERRVSRVVARWKTYLADGIKYLLMEAAFEQAKNAKKSPTALKTVSDFIGMGKNDETETQPTVSRSTDAILRRAGVERAAATRKATGAKGTGDKRPQRTNTVHIVADGRVENPAVEAVPCGDDKALHVVYPLGDEPEGSALPDTEGALEDAVDNDSGAGVGAA